MYKMYVYVQGLDSKIETLVMHNIADFKLACVCMMINFHYIFQSVRKLEFIAFSVVHQIVILLYCKAVNKKENMMLLFKRK